MKQIYLDVMEMAARAYTEEQIDEYMDQIRKNGLPDHGFPRLASCLGVLLANGKCTSMKDRIEAMLELSFQMVSVTPKADHDFSVREMCTALFALEKSDVFPKEKLKSWAELLRSFDPEENYGMLVWKKDPDWHCHNIVSYNCLSEFLRCKLLGLDAEPFLDRQMPKLLDTFDENGMFMDPGCPMVYDFATRLNLQQMVFAGYRGKYYESICEKLDQADALALNIISSTGEFPYGGRSQGFLHNEALLCAMLEGAAVRSKNRGDSEKASHFRAGAKLALDALRYWIEKTPVSHIKNRFPASSLLGCEKYGYFNKYMITINTWLISPVLYGDFSIPVGTLPEAPLACATSSHFHRYFLKAGKYSLQGDLAGQAGQDATGIGRIHKKGCPSPLLLSFPCPAEPKYIIATEKNPGNAAIGVWKRSNGKVLSECDEESTAVLEKCEASEKEATAELCVTLSDGSRIREHISVTESGITLTQEGGDGFLLAAIVTDGENVGTLFSEKDGLSVFYQGFYARYQFLGRAEEAEFYQNRNGIYRFFRVPCDKVTITMGEKR